MTRSTAIPIAVAVCVLAGLLLLVNHWQHVVADNLPPNVPCASAADAAKRAVDWAKDNGNGVVVPVLGTGSMAPYIPAARAGADPLAMVVAYVVIRPNAAFEAIRQGDLCIYRPVWAKGSVMHVAAQLDGDGWIMTGLHNAGFEAQWRVTRGNFVGIVDHTFTWPQ